MSQPELIPIESEPLPLATRTQVMPLATMTPMEMLSTAVSQGNLELVSRMMDLQDRVEAKDAKKAFDEAMNRVQSEIRQVAYNKENTQTKSKYSDYGAIDAVIRPIYTREGFSLSFNTGEAPSPESMRMLCEVSHIGGHSKTYHLDVPADGKGAKGGEVMTRTHATGSAVAYGKRYLVGMIFNIATGHTDDDGNGAGKTSERMPEDIFQEHKANILNASNHKSLHMAFTVAYVAAQATKNQEDMGLFIKARDARKAVLDKEAK